MHARNLFLSLDATKNVPENFCTEALAWIIETDPAARRAILEACAARVAPGDENREAAAALRRLAVVETIRVRTRRWIRPNPEAAYCSPDLSIDDNAGHCCLIEVKQWAKPSRNSSFVPSDSAAEAETGLASNTVEPCYSVQTRGYRQWLDDHHIGQGALIALMVRANDDLSEYCHGTLTWTQLAEAIRVGSTFSAVTTSFVRFLEEKHMAQPSQNAISPADGAALRAAAPSAWAAWMSLLDEICKQMSKLLASGPNAITTKVGQIGNCWNLQVWPEAQRQGFWLGHTEVTGIGQAKIQPWLLADRETVDFVIDVVAQQFRNTELPTLRARMPDVARIEKVVDEKVEILCYLIPLDQQILSRETLEDQAAALAEIAVNNVVRPLLPVLRLPSRGSTLPEISQDCLCCRHETPTDGRRICPLCRHEFQGQGWDGIDAHWRARHAAVAPYEEFWNAMCPAHRGRS